MAVPYRKGLVLSFGLVNVIVTLDGAVGSDSSLTTVCCGNTAVGEHVPSQISMVRKCPTCGEVPYADLKKAQKVGNDFQIVEQGEVAAVRDQSQGATKKMLTLTVHDADVVREETLQGDSVYYVAPDGVAQIAAYSLLYDAVTRHPEKAFLTQFTPSSKPSLFQLKAFQGALVIEQRCWPEAVKAAPATNAVDPDDKLKAQLDMVIESMTTTFDPSAYRNVYAEALGALVASKTAVAGVVADKPKPGEKTVATAGEVDLSSALAAMLGGTPTAVSSPAPVTAPAKRAPRRKSA